MSRPSEDNIRRDAGLSAPSAPVAGRSGCVSPPNGQPRDPWLSVAICFFLALAVWVVFGQTIHHDFVNYDDADGVYENPAIIRGLSQDSFIWAFTHSLNGNWLPLTVLSHALDCQLYGLQPGGHHLTSVLLHGATAILLFLFLQNLTKATWRSAFVAAVFAIHPLHVESVAWVSERKDVLSGLFFVLTLWAYVRYARQAGLGSENAWACLRSARYRLALLLFALGLMSKPMLVTLPFILLLLDYWPLNRLSSGTPDAPLSLFQIWLRLCFEKIPFLLLSVADSGAAILTQRGAMRFGQDIHFPARIGNALVAYAAYLWQMIYPVGLAVFYPHPGNHLSVGMVSLSVLVLLIISAGAIMGWRKHPYLLAGWLWYLGMLVPVIGLIQVGLQARADRYTYLPQIGLYLMAAWGAVELCGGWRWRRVVLGSGAIAIIAGLLAGAYVQTAYWKDSVSLWTRALVCTSDNNKEAHNNLGGALTDQGKPAEAIQHLRRALELKPDYIEAHFNLGLALAGQEKLAEAIQHYERALQLKPDYAEAHNNLGAALAQEGKLIEAIEHFQLALRFNPDYTEAHNNLGLALAKQGKLTEAIEHFQLALRFNPDSAAAYYNLGLVLAKQGKPTEAINQFQQALNLATAQNQISLAEVIRDRLKSFQSPSPQAHTQ